MRQLPLKKDRIKGKSYVYNGVVRIWDGKKLKCEHSKHKSQCKDCGGASICENINMWFKWNNNMLIN